MNRPSQFKKPIACALFGLALFGLFAIWARSTPVGSSNDETFHLATMWCSDKTENRVWTATYSTCALPQILIGVPCFSEQSNKTSACEDRSHRYDLAQSQQFDYSLGIRGVYYRFGQTILVDDSTAQGGFASAEGLLSSVLRIRYMNAFLAASLFSFALWRGVNRYTTAFLVSFLAVSVPLAVFLIASVNPQAWQFIGSCTLWLSLGSVLDQSSKKGRDLFGWLSVLLSLILILSSRSDGIFFVLLVVLCSLVLNIPKQMKLQQRFLLIVFGVIVMSDLAFVFRGRQLDEFLINGLTDTKNSYSDVYYFSHNLPRLVELYFGQFATRIGDSDTWMPPIVYLSVLGMFVLAVGAAVGYLSYRQKIVIGVIMGLMAAIPLSILQLAGYQIGGLMFPRYVWPLLFGLTFSVTSGKTFLQQFSPRKMSILCTGFVMVNSAALFTLVKRYALGQDSTSWNLDRDRTWWWVGGLSPLQTVAVGSAFGLFVAISAYWLVSQSRDSEVVIGSPTILVAS